MLRRPGIYMLIVIIGITCLSLYKASPPPVVPSTAPDTVFSAGRAYQHLMRIAKAPHSIGTEEHKRVREYIALACTQLGLEMSIQSTTAVSSFRRSSTVFAGTVNNIIARLKGKHTMRSNKTIVVMAHYDSQPNTLGAGDDGAAVAAMLETARILKKLPALNNDVLFVFTDGEEEGLLGAKAFISEAGLMNEIGIVLNFEARGSRGISNMFEVNNSNGWVIHHFAKAAAHPFANSLSFEVYKLLPNDTDFTLFKQAGITGLNHAFIERLEDYHSMTDTPEHLDKRSLQHHGENMLSLVKHFGNTDLSHTKGPDITYFNVLGSFLVYYAASWNLFLMIVTCLIFIVFVAMGIRKNKIRFPDLIVGVGFFLGFLLTLLVLTWAMQKGLTRAYPLNNRFNENNSYNSSWYFFAATAAAVGVFGLFYQWAVRKKSFTSIYTGILLIEVFLMAALHFFMPTATYLFCFPILFVLAGQLVLLFKNKDEERDSIQNGLLNVIFSIPAILLFAPTIYAIFVAFGIGPLMPGSVVLVGLVVGMILPVFHSLFKSNKYLLAAGGFGLFLFGIIMAHVNSGFSRDYPLQSNIWYFLDADQSKANWLSAFDRTDEFNKNFFTNIKGQQPDSYVRAQLVNEAPVLSIVPPTVSLQKNSSNNNSRELLLHCLSNRKAISMNVEITTKAPLVHIKVNSKQVEAQPYRSNKQDYTYLFQYFGLPENGFALELKTTDPTPISIVVTDRTLGLPANINSTVYPEGIIPGAGRNSNTIQVKKSFIF